MRTIRGSGQGVECCFNQYRIKCYDKGMQYHLPIPLLRVECDLNSKRLLHAMDIHCLADLTSPEKLSVLGAKVIQIFENSILIEPVNEALLSVSDQKLYQNAERPIFWKRLNKRGRSYYTERFKTLLDNHSLFHLKEKLLDMVEQEWNYLTLSEAVICDHIGKVGYET